MGGAWRVRGGGLMDLTAWTDAPVITRPSSHERKSDKSDKSKSKEVGR